MGFKLSSLVLAALVAGGADAFVPRSFLTTTTPAVASTTARRFGVDPSIFHDLPQSLQHVPDMFASSSVTLSDAADAASALTQPFADAAQNALAQPAGDLGDAAVEVAKDDGGWFGFLTVPIESLLQIIHGALTGVGMSSDSWGITIIAMTILIKLVTFPLTKTQLESTNKMQAIQPKVKALQAKYESNQEVMNQKVAELYQENEVNPLAGCLPSLVQIPVFIGLYRAVLGLAKEDMLDESFLFLPNLEGPTYGADPAHGSDWLFQGWTDAGPALGWDDTIAFLALPILLVLSQFASMQLMQPKDPAAQQNNAVLKLLPLMIGWFSLNVPAALCVYWFVNNIVTTAITVGIKNSMNLEPVAAEGGAATATAVDPSTIFAPPPKKPEGFAASAPKVADASGVKPITSPVAEAPKKVAVIDAEIVESADVKTDVLEEAPAPPIAKPEGMRAESQPKKKRGKKRRNKKNKN